MKEKELNNLLTEDLNIYTAVVMARKDLQNGDFESAISRLKIDADKFRINHANLYKFILGN